MEPVDPPETRPSFWWHVLGVDDPFEGWSRTDKILFTLGLVTFFGGAFAVWLFEMGVPPPW
jgi:hypothetical protein